MLWQQKEARTSDTPVAMSTPHAQNLAPNVIFQTKEPEPFAEIADSLMAEAVNIKDKPGHLAVIVSKELLKIKTKTKCQN